MVVCCGIVGRGACIQSLLVSVFLLVLVFPFLSSRKFSGLTPQSARVHERVHVQRVRDFPQTKLDSEINSPFLLNEHGDPQFSSGIC